MIFTGHYMFIESSALRRLGDNTILQSAIFLMNKPVCLSKSINGPSIGTLKVYTQIQDASRGLPWVMLGNQDVARKIAQDNVGQLSSYQVRHGFTVKHQKTEL